MLHIYFGDKKEAVYNTSVYFDNTYLDEWLEDELTQRIILDVDGGVVLGSRAIDTKALGVIPVTKLSGGTKTLLLILHDETRIFNASTCGDNCAKWILEIANCVQRDIEINLHHFMDFGEGEFEIHILNNDRIVHNTKELAWYAGEFI